MKYVHEELKEKIREIERVCSEINQDLEGLVFSGNEKPKEENHQVRALEIAGGIFTNLPPVPEQRTGQNLGVQVRRVPKEFLGYRVLGRAFPDSKIIEIADDLVVEELEEVKLHELLHIQDPYASEYVIRGRTRSILGKTRWNI